MGSACVAITTLWCTVTLRDRQPDPGAWPTLWTDLGPAPRGPSEGANGERQTVVRRSCPPLRSLHPRAKRTKWLVKTMTIRSRTWPEHPARVRLGYCWRVERSIHCRCHAPATLSAPPCINEEPARQHRDLEARVGRLTRGSRRCWLPPCTRPLQKAMSFHPLLSRTQRLIAYGLLSVRTVEGIRQYRHDRSRRCLTVAH